MSLASTAISRIQITEFSSACPDIAASVVYLFCNEKNLSSLDNEKSLAPLKEVRNKSIFAYAGNHPAKRTSLLLDSILEVR
jgi:hypothetical protein